MPQMNIRFMSKDDRQLAQDILDAAGWDVINGFGQFLVLEIENEQDALRVQDRLEHEDID